MTIPMAPDGAQPRVCVFVCVCVHTMHVCVIVRLRGCDFVRMCLNVCTLVRLGVYGILSRFTKSFKCGEYGKRGSNAVLGCLQ